MEEVYQKYKFPANRAYNLDETSLMMIQNKVVNLVDRKEKKQIASLITLIVCINAAGDSVPLLLTFPCINMNVNLKKSTSPGSTATVYPSR